MIITIHYQYSVRFIKYLFYFPIWTAANLETREKTKKRKEDFFPTGMVAV